MIVDIILLFLLNGLLQPAVSIIQFLLGLVGLAPVQVV